MNPVKSPETVLKTVFGYDTFKPLQREIIDNVLARRDTLVIMPTGGGKSLCYQIPALLLPGLTVVVSPLIALMKDQVEQLSELGVPALFLNSSLSPSEYQENLNQIRAGKIKLLYVAPETLMMERTLALLSSVPFDLMAIDEAHCISEWGHDFRPEYRRLAEVRERFPKVACMALTATATERVRVDIQESLHFGNSAPFVASFNRPNLFVEVLPKKDPLAQVLDLLERYRGQSGIIYCFTRKQVEDLAAVLRKHGYSVLPYHAGLEDEERKRNQVLFIRDDVQIIVATIAFGMGINKPNVRFIIHYDLPKSIESYYQEIGRAGRDGLPAHCLLLFNYADVVKLKYFNDQKEGLERQVAYQHLNALTRYAESTNCRRLPLLQYFGEDYTQENCGMCDRCQGPALEEVDMTIPAQKFMSCVVRTGELFGMIHIVDVLMGSENQKVLKFGHHTLSTYGIGKDLPREQWLHLGRQLINKGYLRQDEEHGSLRLTRQAAEALKQREPIFIVPRPVKSPAVSALGGAENHDPGLFEELRRKRKQLADQHRVPPYAIFPDKTLMEMAAYFPQSMDSLRRIHGVGEVKARRYGPIFLEMITEYCQRLNLPEKRRTESRPVERREANLTQQELKKPRYVEVAEAYNNGRSLPELMESYGIKAVTIIEHLEKYALDGNDLRQDAGLMAFSQVSPDQQALVMEAFRSAGTEKLRPVFDRLNGAISYDELKILRLVFLVEERSRQK